MCGIFFFPFCWFLFILKSKRSKGQCHPLWEIRWGTFPRNWVRWEKPKVKKFLETKSFGLSESRRNLGKGEEETPEFLSKAFMSGAFFPLPLITENYFLKELGEKQCGRHALLRGSFGDISDEENRVCSHWFRSASLRSVENQLPLVPEPGTAQPGIPSCSQSGILVTVMTRVHEALCGIGPFTCINFSPLLFSYEWAVSGVYYIYLHSQWRQRRFGNWFPISQSASGDLIQGWESKFSRSQERHPGFPPWDRGSGCEFRLKFTCGPQAGWPVYLMKLFLEPLLQTSAFTQPGCGRQSA